MSVEGAVITALCGGLACLFIASAVVLAIVLVRRGRRGSGE